MCKTITTWQTVFLFLPDRVECSRYCCVRVVDVDHLPAESASIAKRDRTWRRCVVWCYLARLYVICPISARQIQNTETQYFRRYRRTWAKCYQMPKINLLFSFIYDLPRTYDIVFCSNWTYSYCVFYDYGYWNYHKIPLSWRDIQKPQDVRVHRQYEEESSGSDQHHWRLIHKHWVDNEALVCKGHNEMKSCRL